MTAAQQVMVAKLYAQLKDSLQRSFADLPAVARALPGYAWYGQDKLVDYWRTMSYGLDSRHMEGLRLYAELLLKYRFLDERPAFEFFGLPA